MKYIFLFTSILVVMSCKRETIDPGPVLITADAMVIDEGVAIADGCGWHIIANGIDYIPYVLDSSYAIDSLPVRVTFTSKDSSRCGYTADLFTHPLMILESIELR